jgi:hypothetical protein
MWPEYVFEKMNPILKFWLSKGKTIGNFIPGNGSAAADKFMLAKILIRVSETLGSFIRRIKIYFNV